MDAQKHQLGDISVPIELLDRLDRGENPQLYTKDVVDRTEQRNKELNGKLVRDRVLRSLMENDDFRNCTRSFALHYCPNCIPRCLVKQCSIG